MPLSAASLLSTQSQALLRRVTTSSEGTNLYNTWKYMSMCFDTPRPSSQEEAIRNKIVNIANNLKLKVDIDEAGNVRVRKPATPGYEDRVRIVVQSHLDMVCSKTKESTHDFEKDALQVGVTEDGWVQAEGTTLGADDGIGVAASLMLLENNNFNHGPLECLFTVEEETTMDGAINLAKRPFLEAQALINVDSEEDNSICVGCAGGAEMKLSLPVVRESIEQLRAEGPFSQVTLNLSGLVGGHTGIDIHTNRANAIIVISRMLNDLSNTDIGSGMRICSISGGNAVNAIPRDSTATILVPGSDVNAITSSIRKIFGDYQREFAYAEAKARISAGGFGDVDEAEEEAMKQALLTALTPAKALAECSMKLDLEASTLTEESGKTFFEQFIPVSVKSTTSILALVEVVPHGVIRTSPEVEGDIDTSNALSLFGLTALPEDDDKFWLHCFHRSFSDAQLKQVGTKLKAIATLAGAEATVPFGYFNGWEPNVSSPLFHAVYKTHRDLFPEVSKLRVYSVHAGLECGPIMNQYPDLHAVSIGPLIVSAHSPDEKLRIASVQPFVQWLVGSIEALALVKADEFEQ